MSTPHRTTPGEWRDGLEETLESFDETGGHRVLSRVFDELGVEDALSLVVLPYLHDVGERWSAGSIGVAQEHFASHVLRSRLFVLMEADERAEGIAPDSCRNPELRKSVGAVTSLVRPGLTTRAVMRAVGQPYERLGSTYRFCARSASDAKVLVTVRFSRAGRVTGLRA